MAMAGIPPNEVINCKSAINLVAYHAIAQRADRIRSSEREDLAIRIANAVGELFK